MAKPESNDARSKSKQQAANADRAEAIAAIRAGLADAEAGRVKPAREALGALARKYGFATSAESSRVVARAQHY